MAMDSLAPSPAPLDARTLLARIDRRIVELRRHLAHRHDDEAYWEPLDVDAPSAQQRRAYLRRVAHLLHVERAAARRRIHGGFASLDDQATWLARWEHWTCPRAAAFAGLPADATLARLRDGLVPS
jgi:hypothetical protein